jgi:hypothetical protein
MPLIARAGVDVGAANRLTIVQPDYRPCQPLHHLPMSGRWGRWAGDFAY